MLTAEQTFHANFDMIDICLKNKSYAHRDLSKSKTCDYEHKIQKENNLSIKWLTKITNYFTFNLRRLFNAKAIPAQEHYWF